MSLPDILAPDLDVVFVGINPGLVSAAHRCHFANPRNAFWRALHQAGFTSRLLRPDEQLELPTLRIGITNSVARVTRGSGDLKAADYLGALERLVGMAEMHRPRWLAFVGKDAYAPLYRPRRKCGFGEQEEAMGGARVFVLPSTSPALASISESEKIEWFRMLAGLVRSSGRAVQQAGGRSG